MRVLWLSPNSTFYHRKSNNSYYGGGWIDSLQRVVEGLPDFELGVAFLSKEGEGKDRQGGTTYYSIPQKKEKGLKKLFYYYRGYKKVRRQEYVSEVQSIIEDFKPDIIHLFGIENQLATILGNTSIPVVVHLQGILTPCDNAFFPPGFNMDVFKWPMTTREWIFRNGFGFAHRIIHVRSMREKELFKHVRYAMGRTSWDREMLQLFAPEAKYFHVDEILREPFYANAGRWRCPEKGTFRIVSTLSQTVYKGLDLVLKVAKYLSTYTNLEFEWQVIGLSSNSPMIRFFERRTKIKSKDVHVKYIGVRTSEELTKDLLESNVYVHPSYIDNSPNSVCEAQILGLPVVATAVGGVSTLVENGVTGFLVPSNGLYEMAAALLRLAGDQGLDCMIGKKAFETSCKRHDKQQVVQDLMVVYKSILAC